jgi:hypothetical protein
MMMLCSIALLLHAATAFSNTGTISRTTFHHGAFCLSMITSEIPQKATETWKYPPVYQFGEGRAAESLKDPKSLLV